MEQIFNKLVRDNIPEIIRNNNEIAITRILEDQEYKSELYKKLLEECNEVIESSSKTETIEELADVLEILKSIAELNDSSLEEVIDASEAKKIKRGGFSKKIFLEKTISNHNSCK